MKNKKNSKLNPSVESQVRAAATGAPATIKYLGEPDRAITVAGDVVRRVELFYEPTIQKFIRAVHYDTHFIYQNPDCTLQGESIVQRVDRRVQLGAIYLCTCGAIAGVVEDVTGDVPPEYAGRLACQFDIRTGFKGKHQTSSVNIGDFNRHAGGKRDLH